MPLQDNAVKWVKGQDFMDGSPRYSIDGHDPSYTIHRFQVVITCERHKDRITDKWNREYEASVYDYDREAEYCDGRLHRHVSKAKAYAEAVLAEALEEQGACLSDMKGSWAPDRSC